MVSVAEVAAVISASIVIVQLSYPLLLSLITVGTLKKSNNAASWSVLGRLINGSLWPYILRTDTASRLRVDRRIQVLSALSTLTRILLAITATVTPLGLRSTLKSKSVSNVPFSYVADDSPVGQATQPRDEYIMSRVCGGGMLATPCPGNDDGFTFIINETGEYLFSNPGRDDAFLSSTIAPNITAIFGSNMRDHDNTVARVLDIQWRSFIDYNNATVPRDDENVLGLDHGEPRTQGKFRYAEQMLSENDTWAVEGLVVSMRDAPGIGFRNHTLPPTSEYGYSWSENILWMASQGNPQLRERAWQAATVTNGMIARWLNLTRAEYQTRRSYPLKDLMPTFHFLPEPQRMYFSNLGQYNFSSNVSAVKFDASLPGPLNGFGKSSRDYYMPDTSSLESYVKGYYAGSEMNISTIGMVGGLMLGLGRMIDEDGRLSSDTRRYSMSPGSNYSHNLLACMSAIRVSVMTVDFRLNGTASLQNLAVESVRPVNYSSEAEWPIWAMEKTGRNISEFDPFWGLVSNEHRDVPGLDTVKGPDFWIPAGMSSYWSSLGISSGSTDSAAGADTPFKALAEVYSGGSGTGDPMTGSDYTGASNWFLYQKWMNLSENQHTIGRIIDHIWTDLMANAIVSSTSLLKSSDTNVSLMSVTQHYSGVGYDWKYAIPAFVIVVLYCSLLMLCIFLLATRRLNIDELRHMLNQTSAGRAMTTERYKASNNADLAPTKEWVKSRGDAVVLVGKADVRVGGVNDKTSVDNSSGNEPSEADIDSSEVLPLNINTATREH